MPSARERIATAVTNGVRNNVRNASCTFFMSAVPGETRGGWGVEPAIRQRTTLGGLKRPRPYALTKRRFLPLRASLRALVRADELRVRQDVALHGIFERRLRGRAEIA